MDIEVSKAKFQEELDAISGEGCEFARQAEWQLVPTQYPVIRVVFIHPSSQRLVGFHFACDNWDEIPPSLFLFDPTDGKDLPWVKWPHGGWAAHDSHPVTGRPFLCIPGIREYHTHASHLNDTWDNYKHRASYKLRYIIERVRQRFGVTNG